MLVLPVTNKLISFDLNNLKTEAGNEVRMMQVQLTKLQDDMAGADVKTMQMQEELLHLRNKLLPMADTMPNFALESQGKLLLSSSLFVKL